LRQDADRFTDVDRPLWWDLIEELCERYEAAPTCRASGKPRGRSNFEGERSNAEGDRGKNSRASAVQVAVVTRS